MDERTEKFRNECGEILTHFGLRAQLEKASEELIELADALDDFGVYLANHPLPGCYDPALFDVVEEIADVEIMLEQLKQGVGIRMVVVGAVELKISRTKVRIDNGYYEIPNIAAE